MRKNRKDVHRRHKRARRDESDGERERDQEHGENSNRESERRENNDKEEPGGSRKERRGEGRTGREIEDGEIIMTEKEREEVIEEGEMIMAEKEREGGIVVIEIETDISRDIESS